MDREISSDLKKQDRETLKRRVEGKKRRTRVSKPEQTIHASLREPSEYLETVLMICPKSLVLNGTFQEFFDGFEELGIPRTGSVPHLSLSSFSQVPPFCLSRSGFRSDSIKRLFVAKEAGEALCERCFSLLSILSFSSSLSSFSLFSLHSPFPSVSSVFSVLLCYPPLSLQVEIYKRERVFQGRATGSFLEWEQFGG